MSSWGNKRCNGDLWLYISSAWFNYARCLVEIDVGEARIKRRILNSYSNRNNCLCALAGESQFFNSARVNSTTLISQTCVNFC